MYFEFTCGLNSLLVPKNNIDSIYTYFSKSCLKACHMCVYNFFIIFAEQKSRKA